MTGRHPRGRGFTLVELLIVIGILGLLSAIAYPAYRESVRKGRRTEAQSALVELNQFMERYYTENGRYVDEDGNPPALPFSRVPRDGGTALYALSLTATAESFTISAKPVATSAQGADRCGELTITEAGAKSASLADCWRK